MQTAVQWFFNELQRMQYFIGNDMLQALEQANKMFEQQIIDAYASAVMKENNSDYIGMHEQSSGEIYFNETYGSKGSDKEKINLVEIPQEQLEEERNTNYKYFDIDATSSQTEISDTGKDTADYIDRHIIESMKELAREGFKPQVSEISDEEIEKGAKEWYNKEGPYSASAITLKTWVYAIKWYREQLKQK